jgi:putative glutamine amidotransferase
MSAPLIGIAASFERNERNRGTIRLWRNYPGLFAAAGALPVLLPPIETREEARRYLDRLDGVVLTGGRDMEPSRYGQDRRPETKLAAPERVNADFLWATTAHEAGKPTLAICLGMQVMNVAFGGTLYQHLPADVPGSLPHEDEPEGVSRDHAITIEKGSLLARVLGVETAVVNSYHHQGIGAVAPGFRVGAKAEDGVVEAIERIDHPFYLGVQWHPERSDASDVSRKLVRAYLDAVRGAPIRA